MEINELRVDFGGGETNKYVGYKKCDILRGDDIDFGGIDFNCDTLPFVDNSVDSAVCSHTLEHIVGVRFFLNELHRVMKRGAVIEFIVPYALHPGSYKPVHVNMITECWFDFLRKKNSERIYGYKRWQIIDDSFVFDRDKEGRIYQMSVKMTPYK